MYEVDGDLDVLVQQTGKACRQADAEKQAAYCMVSESYLRGRPLVKCRRLINSKSSTIQNEPKSSSYLTKHLWRERLVRIAFCR